MSDAPSNTQEKDQSNTPETSTNRNKTIIFAQVCGAILTLLAIIDGLNLFSFIGLEFPEQSLYFVIYGLALAAIFIATPALKNKTTPIYDWALAALSLGACLYLSINYTQMIETIFTQPSMPVLIASIIVLVAITECLRRSTGFILFLFMLFFFLFGLFGYQVLGSEAVSVEKLSLFLALDQRFSIVGAAIEVVVTIVIAFIFFGNLISTSGGSRFFTEISAVLMGGFRGGSAKVSIVASGLFGSISGSAAANVVSTGVITIPMMKKDGYSAEKAAGIEAAASTGGQIMPPMMGAVGFLMAKALDVPFKEIVFAALIPSILYFASLFIQADLLARKDKIKLSKDHGLKLLDVLAKGWMYMLPFVVIVHFVFKDQPTLAAVFAIIILIPVACIFGFRGQRMSFKQIIDALFETGLSVAQLVMVAGMAGVVSGVLSLTGFGPILAKAIITIGGGNMLLVLVLVAVLCFILGLGMPTIAVYILLSNLVVPSMIEVGVPPMAAHLFVLYFGVLSMITPPVGPAALAASVVAKSDFIKTGIAAVLFGWPAYVIPFVFTQEIGLLWQGDPLNIARVVLFSICGVYLVSAGCIGFILNTLSIATRFALVLLGLACLMPAQLTLGTGFQLGIFINLIGLVAGIALVVMHWKQNKNQVFNHVQTA